MGRIPLDLTGGGGELAYMVHAGGAWRPSGAGSAQGHTRQQHVRLQHFTRRGALLRLQEAVFVHGQLAPQVRRRRHASGGGNSREEEGKGRT